MSDPVYIVAGGGASALPTSMLAQGLALASSTTVFFTDDAGSSGVLLLAGWYRVFLAPPIGDADGTEAKPYELLGVLEAGLVDTRWRVRLTSTGRVKITYLGTGTGTISWSTGDALAIRNVLGFAANISLLTGASATAPFAPCGVLYMLSRENCTGWVATAAGHAAARAGNGMVTGRTDNRRVRTQRWTSRVHPRTNAEALTYGSFCTPVFPPDSWVSRALQPSGPMGVEPPWSVDEFCTTALGRRLGMALGTLQDMIAFARYDYEVGYLSPETSAGLKLPKSSGNWKAFHDLADFEVSQVEGWDVNGTESR